MRIFADRIQVFDRRPKFRFSLSNPNNSTSKLKFDNLNLDFFWLRADFEVDNASNHEQRRQIQVFALISWL